MCKNNEQIISPLFCDYKKFWNPLELDENMQLINSSIVVKKCVLEFLTRPTYIFDGLCTFNKLDVQKYESVL